MTQLEDQLTSLLVRTADAVEVRPDIDRVLEAGPVIPLTGRAERQIQGPTRRRWPVAVAGAAAAACVVAGVLAFTVGDSTGSVDVGNSTVPPGPGTGEGDAVAVPRFLVTAPGWEVTAIREDSGDDYGGHVGEMTLTDGSGRSISLNWYPAADYDVYVEDRRNGADSSSHMTVEGRDALLFDDGTVVYGLWLDADNAFELRGDNFATVDDYLAVAATIREVDQATWLAALPADTVGPADRAAAVERILAELPVPDGLDVSALAATGTADDTYAVDMEVTHAVICGWVQQWADGTEAGDAAAVTEATHAMTSSRQWRPLEAASGTMTAYIWEVADAMAAGAPLEQFPSLPQGTGYQRHLGCPESDVEEG